MRETVSEFVEGFTEFFSKARRSLKERFNKDPIDTVEALTHFVETRSAYVAQTSLYGYLKTRMGIKFRELFQDDTYSQSIRKSSEKLFVSCAQDLTISVVSIIARATAINTEQCISLARHMFEQAATRALVDIEDQSLVGHGIQEFEKRLLDFEMESNSDESRIFVRSISDLIRFAPVIDEFKELDRDIVENSIRFRWIDIRRQIKKRIEPQGIYSNWVEQGPGS